MALKLIDRRRAVEQADHLVEERGLYLRQMSALGGAAFEGVHDEFAGSGDSFQMVTAVLGGPFAFVLSMRQQVNLGVRQSRTSTPNRSSSEQKSR